MGLALMLMLLLAGLWAGVQERVTTYEDHLAVDLVVLLTGSRHLFADPGLLRTPTVDAIARTPGVAQTARLRTLYEILELPHGKAAVAAVAYEPASGLGGPWDLAGGRSPATGNEIAVDALWAAQHEVAIGDRLPVLGHPMRVVGLTDDTDLFMTPLVFTTMTGMDQMLRATGSTGAVLVTTADPQGVAARLEGAGYTVRSPAQLHETSLRLATDIYGPPMRLMVGVAFAAGTLVVTLVAYTRISEQQRDLGVLKALGATPGRLRRIAVTETMALTALGTLAAIVLLVVARELLAWWRPSFPVVLTTRTITRTASAAVGMALLAAWLPARRLGRLDAASAFRSGR
ncbi:ABC transporter permease [Cellulomonas sp. PSBB021]|uniref:ABC transporter permease n=1 Tax=Cellulomonas sp. PSBB021 TaxID=2003551 RepID=UPI0035188655